MSKWRRKKKKKDKSAKHPLNLIKVTPTSPLIPFEKKMDKKLTATHALKWPTGHLIALRRENLEKDKEKRKKKSLEHSECTINAFLAWRLKWVMFSCVGLWDKFYGVYYSNAKNIFWPKNNENNKIFSFNTHLKVIRDIVSKVVHIEANLLLFHTRRY